MADRELNYTLNFRAPVSIFTGLGIAGLVDRTVVRDAKGLPYIPGSTVKGRLRFFAERLIPVVALPEGLKSLHAADDPRCKRLEDACTVCRLFGNPAIPALLSVGQAAPASPWATLFQDLLKSRPNPVFRPDSEIRPGIALSRRRRVALPDHLFFDEAVPPIEFKGKLRLDASVSPIEQRFLIGVGRMVDALGALESGQWTLKVLSSPKPRHVQFYGKDGSRPTNGPRGRKFYYHHDPGDLHITQNDHTQFNSRIEQRLRRTAVLYASLDFHGLIEKEVSALLYALELDMSIEQRDGKQLISRGLVHKIGMGKPLGLGSIAITVIRGQIWGGAERYQAWQGAPQDLRSVISDLKQKAPVSLDDLRKVLDRRKYHQGNIEYPSKQRGDGAPLGWFDENPEVPLCESGIFEQDIPEQDVPAAPPSRSAVSKIPQRPETLAATPVEEAPTVRPDEQAAWLKEIDAELLLITTDGKELRRPLSAFQGKPSLLELGQWYILSGTRSVRRPP